MPVCVPLRMLMAPLPAILNWVCIGLSSLRVAVHMFMSVPRGMIGLGPCCMPAGELLGWRMQLLMAIHTCLCPLPAILHHAQGQL